MSFLCVRCETYLNATRLQWIRKNGFGQAWALPTMPQHVQDINWKGLCISRPRLPKVFNGMRPKSKSSVWIGKGVDPNGAQRSTQVGAIRWGGNGISIKYKTCNK
eukprot:TRINITY_DN55529_c0_g1_i1.p1 TRINITY_DN55529_c0_g1~~TRINITY_DN55529_c0_g1_i1.p1  ORF type:complete len:105 (-),score=0.88 TRINITY_DN55529_c0_g1_i1:201-515(-)